MILQRPGWALFGLAVACLSTDVGARRRGLPREGNGSAGIQARGKTKGSAGRKLWNAAEHQVAGDAVELRGLKENGEVTRGTEYVLPSGLFNFSFGMLSFVGGDYIGPREPWSTICGARDYAARAERARGIFDLFRDWYLGGEARMERAIAAVENERRIAEAQTETFQTHVDVKKNENRKMWDIDRLGAVAGVGIMALVNWDHFEDCARNTYQIFHDLALEEAAAAAGSTGQHGRDRLARAYFYEGIGSHFLEDLFAAGHIRTPSYDRRCGTHSMHDEDNYNGLYAKNRNGSVWWMFGDSFYFEDFNEKNRNMTALAVQESVDEVYEAFETGVAGLGHSGGSLTEHSARGFHFTPDIELSMNTLPDYWKINTCPQWYKHTDGLMYRRWPWYRLRPGDRMQTEEDQTAWNKFGLYHRTFDLADDSNQLYIGESHLEIGGCWFKRALPASSVAIPWCPDFPFYSSSDMLYSPELAGFIPNELVTCMLYTKQEDYDNDCYDILEVVSEGQNCNDLTNDLSCLALTPRCTWISADMKCVEGSCVAYSQEPGDIVPGDPTPPPPQAPEGFFMSFQGSCAYEALDDSSFEKMPGDNDETKCAELCNYYAGDKGCCTGIIVDSGEFDDCVLLFNDACQTADGFGFHRCAAHGLQTFHKGRKSMSEVMGGCECSDSWYYLDPSNVYSGCQTVEDEHTWGSWCYLATPEECVLGMRSTTQPDQKWRYCGESTCEGFDCPNGKVRRDSVVCYDEQCSVQDCCTSTTEVVDCSTISDMTECATSPCYVIDGFTWDACVDDAVCANAETEEQCSSIGCDWHDGLFSDHCQEATCESWDTGEECIQWGTMRGCEWAEDHCRHTCGGYFDEDACEGAISVSCEWVDRWWPASDYCRQRTSNQAMEISRVLESSTDFWENAMYDVSTDADIISALSTPLDADNMAVALQTKLDAMMAALSHFQNEGIFFAAFDDGRLYSLKSCSNYDRYSCWNKYPDAEYTFGVADCASIDIFNVVSNNITLVDNLMSEVGIWDYRRPLGNMENSILHGDHMVWSGRFTCTFMHPDRSETCEAYTVRGEDYTLGIQMAWSGHSVDVNRGCMLLSKTSDANKSGAGKGGYGGDGRNKGEHDEEHDNFAMQGAFVQGD